MKMQKEKIIILLTVLVDVIGVGIVIPVLPFYLQSFGVSAFIITLLFSVFSLCAFLSAPILGALSDKIGRRPILIISIVSTAIGWFVFASTNVLWILFLGRIIDGLAAGNFSIAQSYLADIAKDDKERTSNLGLIGATFGVGFVVGPAIGAMLATISPAFPFWFVGALATLNVVGALLFLPETHHNRNTEAKISLNPLTPIFKAFNDVPLRARYLAWFLYGLGIATQQSIFALFLNYRFGFTAAITGYIMTCLGLIMIINQGFLLKNFWLKYFKESSLEVWLFLLSTFAFTILLVPNFIIFCIGLLLMYLSQSVLRVVVTSRVSGIAGGVRRGEVLGIMASILSAAMIIGPLVAGALFETHKLLPFALASVCIFIGFIVMKKNKVEPVETVDELLIDTEAF
ncbi:MAG: MFS transporter [Candidatus Paceibacterota bacterium]